MKPDTALLILAVKNWDCLWREGEGWTAIAKTKAWNQIAKIFHPQWHLLSSTMREAYISEIQERWDKLKTNYFDYKKKANLKQWQKKRKPNHYENLLFLDADAPDCGEPIISETETTAPGIAKNNREGSVKRRSHHPSTDEDEISFSSNKTQNLYSTETKLSNNLSERINLNANEHFLLSLLTDLDNMTTRQVSDFKIAVMTLIRDISEGNYHGGLSREYGSASLNCKRKSQHNNGTTRFISNTPKWKANGLTSATKPAPMMTKDSLQPTPSTSRDAMSMYSSQYRSPQEVWQNLFDTALQQRSQECEDNQPNESIQLDDDQA